MDPFLIRHQSLPKHNKRLGILPGSRMPEVGENLCLILKVIENVTNLKSKNTDISFDVALVHTLDDYSLKNIITLDGWRLCFPTNKDHPLKIIKNHSIVNVYRNSFVKVVQSSNVLISMAGTATEQAALLGKLIIQIEGKGPQFNASFAEAQRRLLGPNVFCADGSVQEDKYMLSTCKLILNLFERNCQVDFLKENENQQIYGRRNVEGISEMMAKSITNSFLNY